MTLAKECERMYITAPMTGGSGVQAADATLYCIKITVNATDLFGTVELNIMYPIAGTNTVIRQPQWIKVR